MTVPRTGLETQKSCSREELRWFWILRAPVHLQHKNSVHKPIQSMYGTLYLTTFTIFYHKDQPNVGKYTIHGSCGKGKGKRSRCHFSLQLLQKKRPGPVVVHLPSSNKYPQHCESQILFCRFSRWIIHPKKKNTSFLTNKTTTTFGFRETRTDFGKTLAACFFSGGFWIWFRLKPIYHQGSYMETPPPPPRPMAFAPDSGHFMLFCAAHVR